MMSMPFLIFGGLGAYFYFQVQRARELSPHPRTTANVTIAAGVTLEYLSSTANHGAFTRLPVAVQHERDVNPVTVLGK